MKLIDKLPYFYADCPATQNIQGSFNDEIETLYSKVDSTKDQLYVNSATWGLELWEKFAGITKTGGSLQDRRLKVVSKLTAKRTTTLQAMQELCKSYVKDIEVQEIAREYRIFINLTEKTESDIPREYNLNDLDSSIWEIKPAHLVHEINMKHSRKLNIATGYSDVKFKYIPCNCCYAGQYQPNTYNKDIELVTLEPSTETNFMNKALLGTALIGVATLGVV